MSNVHPFLFVPLVLGLDDLIVRASLHTLERAQQAVMERASAAAACALSPPLQLGDGSGVSPPLALVLG